MPEQYEPQHAESKGLSKTVVFVCITGIAGIGIAGLILLTIHRPDATATFIGQFTTIFATLIGFVSVLFGLNEVKKSTDKIQRNTNGTLSALRKERDAYLIQVHELEKELESNNG